MTQVAPVSEDRKRLCQSQRARIQTSHATQHAPRHSVTTTGQQLARIDGRQGPWLQLDRAQQLGEIQRIAAARCPRGGTELIGRQQPERRADNCSDGALAQQ